MWMFPPPPGQNCDLCRISVTKKMKRTMMVQTKVAMQNIGYVYELEPHTKVCWVRFDKNRIGAVQTVIKHQLLVAYGPKVGFGSRLPAV